MNIYFHLSGFQSSLLLIHFLQSECLAVHTALYQSLAQCHPVADVQIVERGVPTAGSELNRTRGKRGGKRAKIGVRAISCSSLPSLLVFFRRQNFSRALLSERLEQASTIETTLSRTARLILFVKESRQNIT